MLFQHLIVAAHCPDGPPFCLQAYGDCFLVKYADPAGIPAKPLVQHVLQPPCILDMDVAEVSTKATWVEEAR